MRLELAAPLLLIFLTGNALYQTIDKSLAPIPKLFSTLNSTVGLAVTTNSPNDGVSTGVMIRSAVLSLLWLVFSLLVGGWTLVFASRNFAAGVRDRSHEYCQFDVTRSVAATTAANKSKSEPAQGSDVA